jgi:hypothetical protein
MEQATEFTITIVGDGVKRHVARELQFQKFEGLLENPSLHHEGEAFDGDTLEMHPIIGLERFVDKHRSDDKRFIDRVHWLLDHLEFGALGHDGAGSLRTYVNASQRLGLDTQSEIYQESLTLLVGNAQLSDFDALDH